MFFFFLCVCVCVCVCGEDMLMEKVGQVFFSEDGGQLIDGKAGLAVSLQDIEINSTEVLIVS